MATGRKVKPRAFREDELVPEDVTVLIVPPVLFSRADPTLSSSPSFCWCQSDSELKPNQLTMKINENKTYKNSYLAPP